MERTEQHDYAPGDNGNVRVVTLNEETGMTGADTIIAGKTPVEMKAWLSQEYGPQIGVLIARRPDGTQTGIGTMHQKETPYPGSERTFVRTAFVFVATVKGRMTPEQRVAYLRALDLGDAVDAPAKGKRAAKPEPEPVAKAPAKSPVKRTVAKASAKPTKRR
jgi:hypothetical protein